MPRELPQDHHCAWREEAEELKAEVSRIGGELDGLKRQMESLQRRVFGRKTEKLPPVAKELKPSSTRPEDEAARAESALQTRRERKCCRARLLMDG